MNTQEFLKVSLKNMKSVGAIFPTPEWAARSIVSRINPGARCVIEFGPGNGAITKKLLKNLSPDCKVLAIEILEEFVAEIEKIGDPRLIVVHDDVLRVSANLKEMISLHGANGDTGLADVIISGIPFSFISKEDRPMLVERAYQALKAEGVMIVYQSSPLIFPILKRYFRKVELSFEPFNIPPYFIMIGRK